MGAIKTHVEGHLLSMEQYAGLYERRRSRSQKTDTQGDEKIVSITVQEFEVSHSDKGIIHEQDPLDITSTFQEDFESSETFHYHEPANLPSPDTLLGLSQDLCSTLSPQSTGVQSSRCP